MDIKNLTILRDILETVRDRMFVSIIHYQEVAYGLSIGTKSGDLE